MKLRLSHLLVFFMLAGCISPPDYPIEPKIEFLSLSRSAIDQRDSVRIEFSFQDGDGDIGFEPYDSAKCNFCSDTCLEHKSLSLFVFDTRTDCLTPFNVPYVPPKGSSEAISGKINVLISSCCIVNNFACNKTPTTDTVIYRIQLKDRAGHLSNIIEVPPIVLDCNH